jgi:hypothetical protein
MLAALVRALIGAWKKLNDLPPPPAAPRVPPITVPIEQNAPLATESPTLAGRPLRYLIGRAAPSDGLDGDVTEVGYDVTTPAKRGISIAYCNLFDEKNTGNYGPYLHTSDTAAQYSEGRRRNALRRALSWRHHRARGRLASGYRCAAPQGGQAGHAMLVRRLPQGCRGRQSVGG